MIYLKEMMLMGKIIEITILIIGIFNIYFWSFSVGVFLVAIILFDWFFSLFFEKKKFGDYFYSWKCIRYKKKNETKRVK